MNEQLKRLMEALKNKRSNTFMDVLSNYEEPGTPYIIERSPYTYTTIQPRREEPVYRPEIVKFHASAWYGETATEARSGCINFDGETPERFNAFLDSLRELKYNVDLSLSECTLSATNLQRLQTMIQVNTEITSVEFSPNSNFPTNFKTFIQNLCLLRKKEKQIFSFRASYYDKHHQYCSKSFSQKDMDFNTLKAQLSKLSSQVSILVHECYLTSSNLDELLRAIDFNKEIVAITFWDTCGLTVSDKAKFEEVAKKHKETQLKFNIKVTFEDANGFERTWTFSSPFGVSFQDFNAKVSMLKKNVKLIISQWESSPSDLNELKATVADNAEIISVSFEKECNLTFDQKKSLEALCAKHRSKKETSKPSV